MQIGSHFKPCHASLSHLEEKINLPPWSRRCRVTWPVDLSRAPSAHTHVSPSPHSLLVWAGQPPPSPSQLFLKLPVSLSPFGSLLTHHFIIEATLDPLYPKLTSVLLCFNTWYVSFRLTITCKHFILSFFFLVESTFPTRLITVRAGTKRVLYTILYIYIYICAPCLAIFSVDIEGMYNKPLSISTG